MSPGFLIRHCGARLRWKVTILSAWGLCRHCDAWSWGDIFVGTGSVLLLWCVEASRAGIFLITGLVPSLQCRGTSIDIFVSLRACTAAAVRGGRGVTILSRGVTRRHRCGSAVCLVTKMSPDTTNLCLVVSSCSKQWLLQSGADPGPGNSRQGCSGAGPGRGCSSVARGLPAREWCRCDRMDR